MQIDPWGSSQYQDYDRLRTEFGIEAFNREDWDVLDNPHHLFTRGVVFGHRDFERVRDSIRERDPWAVMTGLMPSGDMHLGHKMVMDQCVAHQAAGADVSIAVADFEAVAARGLTLEKARELALDQYVHNYLALGLLPETAQIYFQTRRHRVQDLANMFSLKVKWSQMQQLYGFGGETHLAHAMAPLIQAADILHPQQPDSGGPRPVLVPVGVDQDPHIRLTRDIAQKWRRFNLIQEKGDWVIAVKGEDKSRWLDVADHALTDEGYGTRMDRKRDDRHGWLVLGSHLRSRDIRRIDLALARAESKKGEPAFIRPSATFHRFMTGLTGDKMSSSKPETSIFLTEDPDAAAKKLRSSVTGGRDTAEEQRRLGADPTKCPVYELYLYHLAQDDEHLQTVHDECKGGERLCGGCKGEAAGLLVEFLKEHQEKRDQVAHQVDAIIRDD